MEDVLDVDAEEELPDWKKKKPEVAGRQLAPKRAAPSDGALPVGAEKRLKSTPKQLAEKRQVPATTESAAAATKRIANAAQQQVWSSWSSYSEAWSSSTAATGQAMSSKPPQAPVEVVQRGSVQRQLSSGRAASAQAGGSAPAAAAPNGRGSAAQAGLRPPQAAGNAPAAAAAAAGAPTARGVHPSPQVVAPPQQAGTKTPAAAAAAATAATGAAGGSGEQRKQYMVITYANDANEVGISALLGEYTLKGMNHGRQVFQKTKNLPGTVTLDALKDVEVLLYYWDSRTGEPFEGWWFGNKLGGTQVWAHSKSSAELPPSDGWKVPWNGPVRHTLAIVDKEVHQKAESEERYRFLAAEVKAAEADCLRLMEQVKSIGDGDGCHDPEQAAQSQSPEVLMQAENLLGEQAMVITGIIKKVMQCEQLAVRDHADKLRSVGSQVRKLHSTVNTEFSRMRTLREKGEKEAIRRDHEEKDTAVLEELLADATEKTNTAEDMVEKAAIAGEMIAACGDDADMVQDAISQTALAAKAAQTAIGEARIYLNAKQASCKKLEETVRHRASAELGRLQQQLQEAQQKLNPLKNVRNDYEQKKSAAKLFTEVEQTIALAEVDVDRAEEMLALLDITAATKEGIMGAEEALQQADEHVAKAMEYLDGKKQQKHGVVLEELNKFGTRGDTARKRVNNLRARLKGASEKIMAEAYIAEADEKVKNVLCTIDQLTSKEAHWQEQDLPLPNLMNELEEAESELSAASGKASVARMFVQMKALEVKRFVGGATGEASKSFQSFERQLDTAVKQLSELRQGVTRQRRLAMLREAGEQVLEVEQSVDLVKQAASALADDASLLELTAEETQEASEKTAEAEKNADERILQVKKALTAKQIEAKGKDTSAEVSKELLKLQTRLSNAQTELSKQRKLYMSIDSRIAGMRIVDEARKKLGDAESQVNTAADLVHRLPEPDLMAAGTLEGFGDCVKERQEADTAIGEASVALRMAMRFLESQMRSPGSAKEALARLEPRTKSVQDKLDSISTLKKERSEKLRARGILREAQEKVSECETSLQKAVDAELPFFEGADTDMEAIEVIEMANSVEKAVQAAQAAATAAKCKVSMNRLAAKRLHEASAQDTMEALQKMQDAVEETSKKLQQMRARCSDWKKRAVKRG